MQTESIYTMILSRLIRYARTAHAGKRAASGFGFIYRRQNVQANSCLHRGTRDGGIEPPLGFRSIIAQQNYFIE